MKKLWYIIYLILGKILGKVWIFAAIPFRGYARSVVYNYVLQNDLPLKRLRERNPQWDWNRNGWSLDDIHGVSNQAVKINGYIEKRHYRVSKLHFYLVVIFIYGFLDDDSNHDTTDIGYIKTLLSGERKSWHRIFNPWLRKMNLDVVYGNSFDLGDVRAKYPVFNWAATFVWNDRNTAMNFQYLLFDY